MGKEDFIYKNRILQTLVFTCILSGSILGQPNKARRYDSLIAKVDLQKGFNNDTLYLKINGKDIFRKTVLTSHRISDYTGTGLELLFLDKKRMIILNGNKIVKIPITNSEIHIEILMNSYSFKFYINLLKGKYIGIYKTKDKKLELVQSERRFVYD